MIEFHESLLVLQQKIIQNGTSSSIFLMFNQLLFDYYSVYRRSFPWRDYINPYHVVVSEIMLQQTQTQRVEKKFLEFIKNFPSFEALSEASLIDVLKCWSGLGYNRRAVALHAIAHRVVHEYNSQLPSSPEVLITFPGIGEATAASIVAFAYNLPTIFIETNIRSVFIHCFYFQQEKVHDREIRTLVEKTIDVSRPRDWYYALMDFGVLLKTLYINPSRKSIHHVKQSKFEGSNRQLRSHILKTILHMPGCSIHDIGVHLKKDPKLLDSNIKALIKEGFLKEQDGCFFITE